MPFHLDVPRTPHGGFWTFRGTWAGKPVTGTSKVLTLTSSPELLLIGSSRVTDGPHRYCVVSLKWSTPDVWTARTAARLHDGHRRMCVMSTALLFTSVISPYVPQGTASGRSTRVIPAQSRADSVRDNDRTTESDGPDVPP